MLDVKRSAYVIYLHKTSKQEKSDHSMPNVHWENLFLVP